MEEACQLLLRVAFDASCINCFQKDVYEWLPNLLNLSFYSAGVSNLIEHFTFPWVSQNKEQLYQPPPSANHEQMASTSNPLSCIFSQNCEVLHYTTQGDLSWTPDSLSPWQEGEGYCQKMEVSSTWAHAEYIQNSIYRLSHYNPAFEQFLGQSSQQCQQRTEPFWSRYEFPLP